MRGWLAALGSVVLTSVSGCSECKAISTPDVVIVSLPASVEASAPEVCLDSKCYSGTVDDTGGEEPDRPLLRGTLVTLILSGRLSNKATRVALRIGGTEFSGSARPVSSERQGKGCQVQRSLSFRADVETGALVRLVESP